nr:MAG: hypothetical protein J07AB56_12160 [Candidatus Nanosalinarum sp. J07AB56]
MFEAALNVFGGRGPALEVWGGELTVSANTYKTGCAGVRSV